MAWDRKENRISAGVGILAAQGLPASRIFSLTGGDGVTTVFETAFKSPAFLALVLSHELTHFRQFASARGASLSNDQEEIAAWAQSDRDVAQLGLPAAQVHRLRETLIRGDLEFYRGTAARAARLQKWTLGIYQPLPVGGAMPVFDSTVHDALARSFDDLSRVVAEELARAKAEGRREQNDAAAAALLRVVRKVCSDLNGLTQEDLDSVSRPADSAFVVGSFPGLSKCEMDLFVSFGIEISQGRRLTLAQVRANPEFLGAPASAAAPPAGPDWTASARALRDLALKACSSPASLDEGDMGVCGGGLGALRSIPGFEEYGAALTGCAKSAYRRLAAEAMRRCPLSLEFVRSLARRAASPRVRRGPRRPRGPDSPGGPRPVSPREPDWDQN